MNPNRPVLISVVQYQDELTKGEMTAFDFLDKAQQLGAAGAELRREVWVNYKDEIATARERAQNASLILTYATFSTLFTTDDAAHQLLLHDIDTAAALGSPLLRVFPGAAPANTADPGWAAANKAIEHAAKLGIVIALENYGHDPGGKLKEIVRILDHIPSDSLKTNIDIGNYDTHGEDVPAAIRAVGARAVYAHLKDKTGADASATTALGGGTMPMSDIMTAFNELPQRIIYCFEFVGGGEADSRIEKSLAYLRAYDQ